MSDRTLMCFGYYFPPAMAPEAIVSAKRTVGLKGWAVTFAAFDLGADDPILASYTDRKFHRVYRFQLPWWLRFIPAKILRRLPILPDWLRLTANYAARRLFGLGLAEYNAFMTCSQSHSAHLVGLRIKRACPSMPWIAHFSDPWVANDYVAVEEQARQRKMEREVFEKADLLIFTSEETREHVGRGYSANIRQKMRVLPHAYDPEMWRGLGAADCSESADAEGSIVIRYVGALYGKRSPNSFFQALSALSKICPELLENVHFEFIGVIDAEFRADLEASEMPAGLLTLLPPVSYFESLNLMKEADALLVIDAPAEKSIFLPSKLIDYIGSAKPILALSPIGTTRALIDEYGGICSDPDDVVQIADSLKVLLQKLRSGDAGAMVNADVRLRYHVEQVGELLNVHLAEVLASPPG